MHFPIVSVEFIIKIIGVMNCKYLLMLYFIRFVFSTKIVEYQFITNFGSMFYDYSGNGMHGANSGTVPTDRGAYFSGTSSNIVLPPNTYVSSNLVLGSTPLSMK